MSEDDFEKAVRAELERIAEDQEAIRERLAALQESLPVSPREDVMFAGEEDYDFTTEVRAALECILADRIGATIQALRDLARGRREGPEALPGP
jgi:hypothetical protein